MLVEEPKMAQGVKVLSAKPVDVSPHSRKEEIAPVSCALTSTHVLWHNVYAYTHNTYNL